MLYQAGKFSLKAIWTVTLIDATEMPIKCPKKIKVKNKKRIKSRNNKQKRFYSGKKRRDTLKSKLVVRKKTKQVIWTAFTYGKRHCFRLFKESKKDKACHKSYD